MTLKRYRMLKDSEIEPKAIRGMIVYDCKSWDYGCAHDDTRVTGIEHISVTLKADGDYPFFTVPVNAIEEIPA